MNRGLFFYNLKRRVALRRGALKRPTPKGKARMFSHTRAEKKKNSAKLFFALIIILFSVFAYGYYRFDRRILPLALTIAEQRLTTSINHAIYSGVQEVIHSLEADASDFYIQTPDAGGREQISLAVNTVLINDICNASALAISERLSALPPEPVSVPIGMALGLDTLANTGPRFSFSMMPTGNALVNYESSFVSVGINQVHFEVWLKVDSTIRVVNPVQSSTLRVTRDVSLVDTVISGAVPDAYLNMDGGIGR